MCLSHAGEHTLLLLRGWGTIASDKDRTTAQLFEVRRQSAIMVVESHLCTMPKRVQSQFATKSSKVDVDREGNDGETPITTTEVLEQFTKCERCTWCP